MVVPVKSDGLKFVLREFVDRQLPASKPRDLSSALRPLILEEYSSLMLQRDLLESRLTMRSRNLSWYSR